LDGAAVEGVAEVGWQRVLGGQDVMAGADLDGALAARGADEALDGPAAAVLYAPGDGERAEHTLARSICPLPRGREPLIRCTSAGRLRESEPLVRVPR
jgi:hypothetical protein